MSRFKTGQEIILRQLWRGRIWAVRTALVVQDTDSLIVSWCPPGSREKVPRSPEGERIRPGQWPNGGWAFQDVLTENGFLRLSIPGASYSVLLIYQSDGQVKQWYINLELPLQRTVSGFDEEDQILDVILSPDLRSWRWDDQDELEEALAAGLVSQDLANELYERGKDVVDALRSGSSVFNEWENWRPDQNCF